MKKLVVRGLAALGAAWLVRLAYRALAPEFVDIAPERLSTRGAPDGPAAALAAHLGVPLVDGNRIELLVNGDRIFPAMLASIEEARESINLLSYIYWTGQIARDFAAALAEAALRGVEVRVLLDAVGAFKMDPALVERMRAAGCEVAWFNPVRWHSLERSNHRTHRKVMVVDGRTGFTGGVGIAAEWTGDAEDPEHWRDDHFQVEGPIVRWLQGAFAENWRQATGETLVGTRLFPKLERVGDVRMCAINTGPASATSEIGLAYWFMFHWARERIRIATPYFAPDPNLELGLADAARRGVDVQLLVPGSHQDSWLIRMASQTWYPRLLEAGVRVFEYQPTMMHVKAVTADGQWAIVGSANFDNRSFEINFEVALGVFDPEFTERLDASFASDIARANEITRADVERWSVARHARNRTARLFREQI